MLLATNRKTHDALRIAELLHNCPHDTVTIVRRQETAPYWNAECEHATTADVIKEEYRAEDVLQLLSLSVKREQKAFAAACNVMQDAVHMLQQGMMYQARCLLYDYIKMQLKEENIAHDQSTQTTR